MKGFGAKCHRQAGEVSINGLTLMVLFFLRDFVDNEKNVD